MGEPGYDPLRPKVAGVTASSPKQLVLRVRPSRVTAGRRTVLHFRVSSAGAPVGGARIRVGRTHLRSDAHGRAEVALVVRHAGNHLVTARKSGYRPGHTVLHAVRR